MENTEAFDDENEQVISVNEYFENIDAEELKADLVLGGDEGQECTYSKGYMPRQALFSCLTCTPNGKAGVCTACSLACHDGHQVVEMWTKRKFRCDCGNSKFNGVACRLYKNKDTENYSNVYNQNFLGTYCICHRPYPDSEGPDLGEMLQCCICEDWFHETHLELKDTEQVPKDEDGELAFDEFICSSCAESCSFLSFYPEIFIQPVISSHTMLESGLVNESCENFENLKSKPEEKLHDILPLPMGSAESVSVKDATCKLRSCTKSLFSVGKKAIFLDRLWRNNLCQCPDCQKMYESRKLTFLLDHEDTIYEYEKKAEERRAEKLERAEGAEMAFIKKLGHVEKMEFLYGLNDMTTSLKSFLNGFQESGKAVTCADVHEFFEKLNKKRKRTFQ